MCARGLKHTGRLCCIQALGAEIKQSPSHPREGDEQSGALSKGTLCLSYASDQFQRVSNNGQGKGTTEEVSNTLLLSHKADA